MLSCSTVQVGLEKAIKRSDGSKGGGPPYDLIVMFKILVLQALYTLSDQ